MAEIKLIAIQEAELREIIRQEVTIAINEVLSAQNDELVTIKRICEKIPGMTRYLFKQLERKTKLKNINGRYSLKAVRDALHQDG